MAKGKETDGFFEVVRPPAATNIRFEVISDIGSFFPSHWHPAVEILLLSQGEMEVTLRQQTYHLKPKDCILINPDVLHSTKCVHGCRYLLVQIPVSYLETFLPHAQELMFPWKLHPTDADTIAKLSRFKETLWQMQALEEQHPDGYLLLLNSLLFSLLDQLYRNFSMRLSLKAQLLPSKDTERLKPVLSYTADHYSRHITIPEAAGIAALKPEYFCRFFKKNMGITYLEYLNRIRLSHIYRDLLETKEPLWQLLEKHGFTNYKLFRRMFWEQFNTTPSHIRTTSETAETALPDLKR